MTDIVLKTTFGTDSERFRNGAIVREIAGEDHSGLNDAFIRIGINKVGIVNKGEIEEIKHEENPILMAWLKEIDNMENPPKIPYAIIARVLDYGKVEHGSKN